MKTKDELLELARDLEITDSEVLISKLLQCSFCDANTLYAIMDDSLNELEFLQNFCKSIVIDTETTEIYEKIRSVLIRTTLTVDDIIEYVLNCESETQFSVTLDLLMTTGTKLPVPTQETGELIYYNLIDMSEYIESLTGMYGQSTNR